MPDIDQAGLSQTSSSPLTIHSDILNESASPVQNSNSISSGEVSIDPSLSQNTVANFAQTRIEWALELHSNNNFTKKDVISIQKKY